LRLEVLSGLEIVIHPTSEVVLIRRRQKKIIVQNVNEQLVISVGTDATVSWSSMSIDTEHQRAMQECFLLGLVIGIGISPPSWRGI
jgi:hypothetical protein